MTPVPVELPSTSLFKAAYDDQRAILQIQFRDGNTYDYASVPPELFQALLAAPSKGVFFNHHIRGRFPFVKGDAQ